MKTDVERIIAGFAQADPKYGLSKKNNFLSVVQNLKKFQINKIDTSPTYANSSQYVLKINNLSSIKLFTKLSDFDYASKNLKI